MDIERSEVNAIKAMYEDGILENIKQIGVEVMYHSSLHL